MLDDLRLLAGVVTVAGIAFGVYMIIHRYAARNSDARLRLHIGDPDNRWIEEEDLGCCVQMALFVEVDEVGNYRYSPDASLNTDSSERLAFMDRITKLLQVVEARLGRIPNRIYFDKAAWQQVKEDRARWHDIAHLCRKTQALLGDGVQGVINSR